MLEFLKTTILKMLLPTLVERFDTGKDKIFEELNRNIDIPIIDEKTERQVLEAIYAVFRNAVTLSVAL